MYHKIVKSLLSLSKKHGGKTSQLQQVEVIFYADSEDKGSNLAIELSKLGYQLYGIERSANKWSIIGATPLMKIDEECLTKWGDAMYALGEEMEVLFDGFGMLIEK